MVGYSNSYTLTRPKDEFGKLAKYTKLLDFVKAHRTEEFSRVDLFVKSGYWNISDLNRFTHSKNWKGDAETMNTAFRGQNCYVTAKMHDLGVIEYNRKTRRWHCGKNIDSIKY